MSRNLLEVTQICSNTQVFVRSRGLLCLWALSSVGLKEGNSACTNSSVANLAGSGILRRDGELNRMSQALGSCFM